MSHCLRRSSPDIAPSPKKKGIIRSLDQKWIRLASVAMSSAAQDFAEAR